MNLLLQLVKKLKVGTKDKKRKADEVIQVPRKSDGPPPKKRDPDNDPPSKRARV